MQLGVFKNIILPLGYVGKKAKAIPLIDLIHLKSISFYFENGNY